ncbi:Cortactin-binding protein 2, partial [Bienertia sinuspersici]
MDHLNHQLSFVKHDIVTMKANLKALMEEVKKLEEKLTACQSEQKDKEANLQEACQRVALVEFELELYKVDLESYKTGEEELIDQLCSCKEKSRNMEVDLHKAQAHLSSVNCELQSTKNELDTSKLRNAEHGNSLIRFEFWKTKTVQQFLEVELEKALDHLCTIDYELMSTNQKLDQLLVSKLWEK